jgi:hypothetical protein
MTESRDVRAKCYAQVRAVMRDGVSQYYREHPDLLNDPRSKEAVRRSLDGLRAIIQVLDGYEITDRRGGSNG